MNPSRLSALLIASFVIALPATAGDDAHGAGQNTDGLSQGPGTTKQDPDTDSRTFGATTKDAAITATVKTKLLADRDIAGMKIDVDTRDKIVTLSGIVATPTQMARAATLASGVDGVTSVRNKLLVSLK
ncbi:MAG: BON domain-containing protein [Panacagrimonas sp.]